MPLWSLTTVLKRTPPSVLSFNGKVVEVQQDGGPAILRYDLENPVSGGVVSAECADTWVHSFQTDEAGVIKFTVDPNPDEGTRDTKVKVSYSVGKLGFEATIRQSSTGPVQDQFVISIEDTRQSGVVFTVTPVDNAMRYLTLLSDKVTVAGYADDAAWFAADMTRLTEIAAKQELTLEQLLGNVTFTGKQQSLGVENLKPETEYYVYAYGLTLQGELTTVIVKKAFTTLEKTDCTFTIDLELDFIKADATFTPSDKTIPYYATVIKESRYQELGGSMPQVAQNEILGFLAFCEAMGLPKEETISQMRSTGIKAVTYDLDPSTKYYLFACAVDDTGMVVSDVAVKEFTTDSPGDASQMTFEFAVSDITLSGATLKVTPSNRTCLYYMECVAPDATAESVKTALTERIEWFIETGLATDRADFMNDRGWRGNASGIYTLESGTEYKPYAIGINEDGSYATEVMFGDPFSTLAVEGNEDISISIVCDKYFDGNALARKNSILYGKYEGAAVLHYAVETEGEVVNYFFGSWSQIYGMDFFDPNGDFTDEVMIPILVRERQKTSKHIQAVQFDQELVVMAVAVDAEGNYSKVDRKLYTFKKAGVSPVEEFDDSAPAQSAVKHTPKTVTTERIIPHVSESKIDELRRKYMNQ